MRELLSWQWAPQGSANALTARVARRRVTMVSGHKAALHHKALTAQPRPCCEGRGSTADTRNLCRKTSWAFVLRA